MKDSDQAVRTYLDRAERELGAIPQAGSVQAANLRRARAAYYMLKAEIVSLRLRHGADAEPIEED